MRTVAFLLAAALAAVAPETALSAPESISLLDDRAQGWQAAESGVADSQIGDADEFHADRFLAVTGLSALCIGGYAVYGFAFWWDEEPGRFHMTREGNMEQDSYAGGADKLGHAWACYLLTRGFSGLLNWSGAGAVLSEIIGIAAVQAVFLFSEIEDAYFDYGFSWWDVAFNFAGSCLGALLDLVPWLDRAIDFRFWYAPTSRFRDVDYNMAEDYSGQKYFMVLKLDGIPAIRETAAKYLEFYVGYATDGYKPRRERKERHVFFGLSVDVFGLLKSVLLPALGAPRFAGDAAALIGEYWHPHFVHAPVYDAILD